MKKIWLTIIVLVMVLGIGFTLTAVAEDEETVWDKVHRHPDYTEEKPENYVEKPKEEWSEREKIVNFMWSREQLNEEKRGERKIVTHEDVTIAYFDKDIRFKESTVREKIKKIPGLVPDATGIFYIFTYDEEYEMPLIVVALTEKQLNERFNTYDDMETLVQCLMRDVFDYEYIAVIFYLVDVENETVTEVSDAIIK